MSSARLLSLATPSPELCPCPLLPELRQISPASFGSFRRSSGGHMSSPLCNSLSVITRATTAGADSGTSLREIKTALLQSLQGIDRGIFGLQSQRRSEIEELVRQLEDRNPNPDPTAQLEQVDGSWKLLYSSITILGAKRTKLGLRDFISLGDFIQIIDVAQGKAVNEISFSARGLKMITGKLTIVAAFSIATKTRVDISFQQSRIEPPQLMNLFQKNYDLLLAIFNPEGWLEITYVDDSIRIGRDDKGNIFILERDPERKSFQ